MSRWVRGAAVGLSLCTAFTAVAAGGDGGTAASTPAPAAAAAAPAAQGPLAKLDQQQQVASDFKGDYFVQETVENKKVGREFLVFRRDTGKQFVLLVTAPKAEAGSGYLRVENNLWSYDPRVGRWERRTERDRLAGTNLRRSDLDDVRFSEDYTLVSDTADKIADKPAHRLEMKAKPDREVAFPTLVVWIDDNFRRLKQQELSAAGKLMRTTLLSEHVKVTSPTKKMDVWIPKTIEIHDELEKGRVTVLKYKGFDLAPVQDNVFTKAWLETRSR